MGPMGSRMRKILTRAPFHALQETATSWIGGSFAGKRKFFWLLLLLFYGLFAALSEMNARQDVRIQIIRAESAIETARKHVRADAQFEIATKLLKQAKEALEDRRYTDAEYQAIAAMRAAQESTENRERHE